MTGPLNGKSETVRRIPPCLEQVHSGQRNGMVGIEVEKPPIIGGFSYKE